jgi:hypothetical protein
MNWNHWCSLMTRNIPLSKHFHHSQTAIQPLTFPRNKDAKGFKFFLWVIEKIVWTLFPSTSKSKALWVRERTTGWRDGGALHWSPQYHALPHVP